MLPRTRTVCSPLLRLPGLRLPSSASHPHLLRLSSSSAASSSSPAAATPAPAADTTPALFTTPIFYPSAIPHVGHLHSLVLTDVLARYSALRQPSRPVLFSTGTDEHGLKIQQAARKAGLPEHAFVEGLSERFKQLARDAEVEYTTFIRTSEERHHAAVAHFWNELAAKGHIYKGSHEGWYAISDEAFYPATQVKDVPSPADPTQTIKVSAETGSPVEWSSEDNYKFRLSAFREPLLAWLESEPCPISPPKYARALAASLRADGLDDLSISRPRSRLAWGVPVPGDASHTIYVWFDALINYLTVVGYPSPAFAASGAWPAELQVLGKDIVRFHAIYWPALLLAHGLPPPKRLLVHAHWTMGKLKMSKSRGNVADPNEAMARASVESVRAYLMGIGGDLREDADYNYANLTQFHKILSDQIGNLVLRFSGKKITGRLVAASWDPAAEPMVRTEDDAPIETALRECKGKVEGALDGFEVGKAVEHVLALVGEANARYSALKPWLPDAPLADVAKASFYSLSALRLAALLLHPIMPGRTTAILDKFAVPPSERVWARTAWEGLEDEGRRAGDWPAKVQDGVRRKVGGKFLFARIVEDDDAAAAVP